MTGRQSEAPLTPDELAVLNDLRARFSRRDWLLHELRDWELRSGENFDSDTDHQVARGRGDDVQVLAEGIPYWRACAIESAIWALGHLLAGLDPEVGFD